MKAFKWIDWGTLIVRLGKDEKATVRLKYYGDIVDTAAELEALGPMMIDGLVKGGQATFDLEAPLDPDLVKRLAEDLKYNPREQAEARATKDARDAAAFVKQAAGDLGVFGEDAARGLAIPTVGLPPEAEA